MRRTLLIFIAAAVPAAVALSPNLIPLFNSTITLTNDSPQPIRSIDVQVDNRALALGPLAPDDSTFGLLPKSGDSTLMIRVETSTGVTTGCRSYVEGEMYHVDALVRADGSIECDVSISALFGRLILAELIRPLV